MRLFIVLFCVGLPLFMFAQATNEYLPNPKYPELFKAVVPVRSSEPQWVHLLYAQEPNAYAIEQAFNVYFANHPFEKTIHTQNYKHFFKQLWRGAYIQDDGSIEVQIAHIGEAQPANKVVNINNWQPIGPFDTYSNSTTKKSSQVNIYTLDQGISNDSILLCGTETAGVYKSIDKGNTWSPLGDFYFTEGITVVKIDPINPNILFVGSSNALHRSLDGGQTWSVVLSLSGLNAYEMVIQPSNNQVIHLAGNKGLHRSTDGGATWTQVFTTACWDVKYASNSSTTLFLLKSNTTKKISEFFKSTDGGLTWVLKPTGWYTPTGNVALSDGGSKIGVTNADVNVVYCVVLGNDDSSAEDNNYIGIFKSSDGGETWSMPYDGDNNGAPDNEQGGPYSATHWCLSGFNNTDISYNQGFYNLGIDVSDSDPNKFLVGMLNLYKSENGGVSYTNWGGYQCTSCSPGYRHPDHQDILINGNDIWVATDGGLDKYDASLNLVQSMNNGITGSDYWGFGQGWNDDVVVGGRYHNGNAVYHKDYQSGKFISLGGGEASTGYVNMGENNLVYHSDISGKKVPFTFTGTISNIPGYNLYPNESYVFSEKSEVVSDPRYYNQLYLGKDNVLHVSYDGGATFSPLFTFGAVATDLIRGIEVSRQDPTLLYVVQKVGATCKVYKSTNGGLSWFELILPSTHANAYISLNANNVLFLALGNGSTSNNKIFKSNNGGITWTNLTSTVLNTFSLQGVLVQEGTNNGVYIHSNKKIWYKNDDMAAWMPFNVNLPFNFSICKMLPFYKEGKIRVAGTRGIWESDLYETSLPVAQPMVSQKTVDCHRIPLKFEDYSALNHTGASWLWAFPGAATVSSLTARNPQVTYTAPGLYSVSLTVTDSAGVVSSKTIPNMIEVLPSSCTLDTIPKMALRNTANSATLVSSGLTHGNQAQITITGWYKPTGIQSAYSGLVVLNTTSSNSLVLNVRNNNEVGYHFKGNYWGESSGLYLPADEWSFVALRLTPTQLTLFVNDKSWTSNHAFTPVDINQILLGKYFDWSSRTFIGDMEEVCIWKTALTDDQVRLGRHLIKPNLSDTNLLAYYQFNALTNGKIYDCMGTNDISLSGASGIVSSNAPVGPGTSEMQLVNAAGSYPFWNAKAAINFSTSGPNGKVVVSHINLKPFNDTLTNSVYDEYWILDQYGANPSFSGMSSLKLKPIPNVQANSPSNMKLFKRGNNGFLTNQWVFDNAATFISTSNEITFMGTTLTGSNQFYLGKVNPTVVVLDQDTLCSTQNYDLTSPNVTQGSDAGLTFSYWNDATATLAVGTPNAVGPGQYFVQGTNPLTGDSEVESIVITSLNPSAPQANDQVFCDSASINALQPSGSPYQWYEGTGGGLPLASNAPLTSANYFVTQTQGGCESPATTVLVTIQNTPPPVGTSPQEIVVNTSADATIEDLTVTGTSVVWYANQNDALQGTNALAVGTVLVDGENYFAVQSINGCPGEPLEITAVVTLNASLSSNESFNDLVLFPNPTIDALHVEAPFAIDKITLYSLHGQLLQEVVPLGKQVVMNLSAYAAGVYHVVVHGLGTSRSYLLEKE